MPDAQSNGSRSWIDRHRCGVFPTRARRLADSHFGSQRTKMIWVSRGASTATRRLRGMRKSTPFQVSITGAVSEAWPWYARWKADAVQTVEVIPTTKAAAASVERPRLRRTKPWLTSIRCRSNQEVQATRLQVFYKQIELAAYKIRGLSVAYRTKKLLSILVDILECLSYVCESGTIVRRIYSDISFSAIFVLC